MRITLYSLILVLFGCVKASEPPSDTMQAKAYANLFQQELLYGSAMQKFEQENLKQAIIIHSSQGAIKKISFQQPLQKQFQKLLEQSPSLSFDQAKNAISYQDVLYTEENCPKVVGVIETYESFKFEHDDRYHDKQYISRYIIQFPQGEKDTIWLRIETDNEHHPVAKLFESTVSDLAECD